MASTGTLPRPSPYRGRFAPSPTGPLHFGSLVAALGSFLQARAQRGVWLLRIEDIDTPRCEPGAVDAILHALEAFGLHWDESVMWQSQRHAAYAEALDTLRDRQQVYPCACTRREIADAALASDGATIYPGTCRGGLPAGREARAWRLRADDISIAFQDALQGRLEQRLALEVGDFILRRADGLYAYQLAVVVDDGAQRITEVVRGSDLLDSTPRQIYLQRLLGLPTPAYLHLPVAASALGDKLSKQTGAAALDPRRPVPALLEALRFLGQPSPAGLADATPAEILDHAIAHWSLDTLPRRRSIALAATPEIPL